MLEVDSNISLEGAKQQILMAATEVFAECGYKRGTVREIARRAGVNSAAISYHFGSKERLYTFVFSYWKEKTFQKHFHVIPDLSAVQPETALRLFVESLFTMLLDRTTAYWFIRLFVREIAFESTAASKILSENSVENVVSELSDIINALFDGLAPHDVVKHCTISVIAQCISFFYTNTPILDQIFHMGGLDQEHINIFTEHVVAFSLCAISKLKDQYAVQNISHSKHCPV